MTQGKLKQHKHYIFFRVYCLITILLWNVFGIWELVSKATPQHILLLLPFVIPAIFMCFSWGVFPWKYSIFGCYERTPFPLEEPILLYRSSWGQIAWFSATFPFFSWSIYSTGLGISILGVGKVFIPAENIVDLQFSFVKGYRLRHNSMELRNPVTLPSKKIFEALQDILKKYGKHFA